MDCLSLGRSLASASALVVSVSAAVGEPPCDGEIEQSILANGPGVERTFLKRVRVGGAASAWAVGYQTTTQESFTYILRFDGEGWQRVASPSPENVLGDAETDLNDLDVLGGDDAWAVGTYTNGNASSPDTLALHWDGTEWRHVVTPGQSGFGASGFLFEAVRAFDADNVWFGGQAVSCVRGDAYLVRRRGSGGFEEHCVRVGLNGVARVRDIDGTAADDVWAVGSWGGVAVATGVPFAVHWNGSSWTVNSPPQTGSGEVLYAVAAVAQDDAWATGVYRRTSDNVAFPLYWHWDGTGWTRFEAPGYAVDLKAFSADDIYGVSGASIVHWDGTAWSVMPQMFGVPGASSINMVGVDALGDCELLFAGHTLSPWQAVVGRLRGGAGCAADFNGDGAVNSQDFFEFLAAFFVQEPRADFNGDGSVDSRDFFDFLNAFFNGCP